jgi:hypothetical protein
MSTDRDDALSMFVNTGIVAPQHQQQRSNTNIDDALLFLAAPEHAWLTIFDYQYHGLHQGRSSDRERGTRQWSTQRNTTQHSLTYLRDRASRNPRA